MISEQKPKLPFSYSKRLYNFVLKCREKITLKDRLVIGIIWGSVGSGKSVRCHEMAHIVSGDKITLEKIAFDKKQFIDAVLMSRKEAIIGDEGIAIFFSRGAMTKEGRLMAELMGQCRQNNLFILICIPDILSVDSLVLGMANFICHVWENEKYLNGRWVTIKGNMAVYPRLRRNDYLDRMIRYLRIKRANSNPYVKVKKPRPWHLEPGSPYGPEFKPAFYCVDEQKYKAKKESVLDKYRNALQRKPRNDNIDYHTMDKLIKSGVKLIEISKMMDVSYPAVKMRKAYVYSKDKSHKKIRRRHPKK